MRPSILSRVLRNGVTLHASQQISIAGVLDQCHRWNSCMTPPETTQCHFSLSISASSSADISSRRNVSPQCMNQEKWRAESCECPGITSLFRWMPRAISMTWMPAQLSLNINFFLIGCPPPTQMAAQSRRPTVSPLPKNNVCLCRIMSYLHPTFPDSRY